MSKWNLSSLEPVVNEWNVTENGDEGGLREESEVAETVGHALLGEGQVSGLADHEISPLDANDGDEVSGLSVLERLS